MVHASNGMLVCCPENEVLKFEAKLIRVRKYYTDEGNSYHDRLFVGPISKSLDVST